MDQETEAKLDALAAEIDQARAAQLAHIQGCGRIPCATCQRLQRRVNHLYGEYADLLLTDDPDYRAMLKGESHVETAVV